MPTGQHVENQFLPTLGQAVRFRELVDESSSRWDKQCLATATSFFCVAAVEAAANGMLQLVAVSSKVDDLIDRFPVIEKIDFVASARGKYLDRGTKAVQEFRILIRDRNTIVHPKLTATEVDYDSLPGDEHFAKRHVARLMQATDGSIEREQALKSVTTAVAFLDYVVADLLALTQTEAELCLVGIGPTSEQRPAYHVDSLRTLLRYERSFKRVRFLDLPTIPGEGAA